MSHYDTSIEIHATPERVWRLLSAVEAWPQWLPTVSRVEVLDGTPLQLGRRYRVEQPKLRPAVWTVSVLEPGRRFQWRATSPGMTMVGDHAVEPAGDRVRVHLSFAFGGLLGRLLGRAFGGITRRYIEQEARALKQRAEAA